MASKDLVINIIGNAQSAVQAFDDVTEAAGRQKLGFDKVKVGISAASAAIVAGVGAFAGSSIDAYTEAEASQAALAAAYEKFPAVTSVSIDALRALNTEIQRKTGYDDDALAASQATLAQFGLTGEQIQQLTPLMADYATKTGKDLSVAAEDMGRAVLGQGRALKQVGVDFTDSGSAAGNFEQLINGLDGTVGGFATTMGDTAAGKAKILEQNFGDIQETVGEMLVPALTSLTEIGAQVAAWLADNPAIIQAVAIAVGVLTGAIIAANVAMWAMAANPIVLLIMAIIIAVGLLIAGIWLLVANWDTVVAWITQIWQGFVNWIAGAIDGFVARWKKTWSDVGRFIANVWNNGIVAPIRNAWNWVQNQIKAGLNFISRAWNAGWQGLGNVVRNIWNSVLGWVENGVNGAIGLINNLIRGVNTVGGAVGIHIDMLPKVRLPRLATGGVTRGPMAAIIGDNPGGRELVEPVDDVAERLERVALAAAAGAGSAGGSRMHPEDIRDLARAIGETVYPLIMKGAQKTVVSALGG